MKINEKRRKNRKVVNKENFVKNILIAYESL